MGFFDFMKEKSEEINKEMSKEIQNGNSGGKLKENNSLNSEEKRQKIARRIMDISEKLDNLSMQVYHLQQRVELLEKKLRISPQGE